MAETGANHGSGELTSGNLLRVTPAYHFQVVAADPDDNIFTDCAITAGADFLITEDRHFAPLADAGYKPRPISPQEFNVLLSRTGFKP